VCEGAFDNPEYPIQRQGFFKIVKRPQLGHVHCRGDIPMPRHHNDFNVSVHSLQSLQRFDTIHPW
jgi:hypothetical protein